LAHWLLALSHESPFEKPQARLAQAGNATPLPAAPRLLALLEEADPGVRLRAAQGLGDLAEEVRRILPVLRAALEQSALHDEDEEVRNEAVDALLRAGPLPTSEVGALVDALHSNVGVVRCHAAIALGEQGGAARPAVPTLIHVSLWDEELSVQVAAAMALWKIERKGPLVRHVLVRALGSGNELICWLAAECLGQMGAAAREAVPALRRALRRDFRLSIVKKGVRLALESLESPAQVGRGEPRGG
jgi:HEAT repeat protein